MSCHRCFRRHHLPVAAALAAAVAAVAGEAAKDLGRIRPAKDLGCRVGQDRDKTAKDLGRVFWVRSGWAGHNLGEAAKDLGRGRAAIVVAVVIIVQKQQQ